MPKISLYIYILFVFLILISLFIWIKLINEVNKLKKIKNLEHDLEIFKSPFFLNKLNQIKIFSLKNNEYKNVYNYLLSKYIKLIYIQNKKLIKKFTERLKTINKFGSFFFEGKFISKIYKDFENNKKKIIEFSDELDYVFALENYVFKRLNLLSLILDKTTEEVIKIKLISEINVNKTLVEIKENIENLTILIEDFEFKIYQMNENEIEKRIIELSEEINIYVEKVLNWIKNLFLFEVLKQKQKKLLLTIEKTKVFEWLKLVQKVNIEHQKINIRLFIQIQEFIPYKTEYIILEIISDIEQKIKELNNIDLLKTVFFDSFLFVKEKFKILQIEFSKFNELIVNFDKTFFFNKRQEGEYKQLKVIKKDIKKNIDLLTIDETIVNKEPFLSKYFVRILTVLYYLDILLQNLPKIINFFNIENKKNNEMFNTLINTETLLNKSKYFYLKDLYEVKYNRVMNEFLNFKKLQLISSKNEVNLIVKYDEVFVLIKVLKKDIQNTVLLKNIADALFVKVNRFRFNNDLSRNKILNSEISFIKNDFNLVIEKLIEIFENERILWKN